MKASKIPNDQFKLIYSIVPRLCVDLIAINKNRVLLAKRNIPPKKDWWHFPGGTVLLGESLKETAKRIALEELGVKISINKLLGYIEYKRGSGFGYPISIVFLVNLHSFNLKTNSQTKELNYFSKAPIKTLPEVKNYLKNIVGSQKI